MGPLDTQEGGGLWFFKVCSAGGAKRSCSQYIILYKNIGKNLVLEMKKYSPLWIQWTAPKKFKGMWSA